jgi:hypothetical protein
LKARTSVAATYLGLARLVARRKLAHPKQEPIMLRNTLFATLIASSAMTLALAQPASAASTSDRAREAIAAAEAKVHTAENLGAGSDAPRDAADAQAALASAKEDFAHGDREVAIREAIRASALADTAIGMAQQHKNAAVAAAREDQRATVDAARDQISSAQGQAAAAQDQTVAAQQQADAAQREAAAANARAESAQQSAAASAADAAAARNAAAQAAAQPPPAPAPQVETTVTTQKTAAGVHHATKTKTVTHATTSAPAPVSTDQVTTTTKVTPQ